MRVNRGSELNGKHLQGIDPDKNATNQAQSKDGYVERLVKLEPAESISAYPVIMLAAGENTTWTRIVAAYSLLALTIFLRAMSSREEGKSIQWIQVGIAGVSFMIWVEVLNGTFGFVPMLIFFDLQGIASQVSAHSDFLVTLILVIWTISIPVIYIGD